MGDGDPHDGSDAACGTCTPTASDCACVPGWYDTDGNVLNGCEGDCDFDNDGYDADTPACGGTDCNDSDPDVNPGEAETCNYVDDDCNGLTDDGTSEGFCTVDDVSACEGSVDCASYNPSECLTHTSIGCSVAPGRCNESGVHCAVDSNCTASPTDSCEHATCMGSPTCNQFVDSGVCNSYNGCDWNSTLALQDANETCAGQGGVWTCSDYEICSNNHDEDLDEDNTNIADGDPTTGVDCMDLDCNEGGSLSLTDNELSRYNCLGTNRTGDINYPDSPPNQYYCSVPESDDSVELCCPVGQEAYYDSLTSTWACQPTEPCYPTPLQECGYKYSAANFTDWISSVGDWQTDSEWCVDPSAGRACCLVVQFGEEDYWSDASGNVKVY